MVRSGKDIAALRRRVGMTQEEFGRVVAQATSLRYEAFLAPHVEVPKLEHRIVSIRHIEHHTGPRASRIRIAADFGIVWVGARRKAK